MRALSKLVRQRPVQSLGLGSSLRLRKATLPPHLSINNRGRQFTSAGARQFAASMSFSNSNGYLSESEQLYDLIKNYGGDKWGLVVYRTTYRDDDEWNRAVEAVRANSKESLQYASSGVRGFLQDRMDWVFVSDKASLDGATRADLRERFRRWADSPHPTKVPDGRYAFFLEIDEPSLRSIIDCGAENAHYNLIDSRWKPYAQGTEEMSYDPEDVDEPLEPIDGCTEEDVGWMKVNPVMLGSSFCWRVEELLDALWDVEYVRPPRVSKM